MVIQNPHIITKMFLSAKWLHEIKKFGLQIIMILRRNLINKFEIKIFILIRDAFLRDLGEVL